MLILLPVWAESNKDPSSEPLGFASYGRMSSTSPRNTVVGKLICQDVVDMWVLQLKERSNGMCGAELLLISNDTNKVCPSSVNWVTSVTCSGKVASGAENLVGC